MATGYRKRNFIDRLEVEGVGIIENEEGIESEANNFFKRLYSSNEEVGWGVEALNWCPIGMVQAAWIKRPFEEEEVRIVVFYCGKDKLPGADGFTLFFFQFCWDIVKCDLMKGAFEKNRQILNAVLVANGVVEDANKSNKSGLVFKIDFKHVEWRFMDDVLERKGFGGRWRSWIRGCLESVNFSIMINGRPRGKFTVTRGVRQGDPLSPFLFTLVIDVLSRLMEKAQENNFIHGLITGRDRVECCRFEVGRGNRVRFWEHNWAREGVLKDIFPRLFALSKKHFLCITHFVDIQVFPYNWDFGFKRNLNELELAEVIKLLDILDGIRLSPSRLDRRWWELEGSGSFSCKSFCSFLLYNGMAEAFPPYSLIWKAKSSPKNIWMERNMRIFYVYEGVGVGELWDRVKFWAALWASVTSDFKDYSYSTILRDMAAAVM
ncbi:hypothetical protein L3X38_029021 [Prunus dulcis]|uniref:Reverse transcriptase domain-containing protein n=1 Tax=Prunus dulcis TaxID=3755 RepID=A0AAD4VQU9_PRUDU|nr:hypothetical protein L3X38_029021 [Prunus dulcis]